MSQNGKAPDERAPLLPPAPTIVDASDEITQDVNDGHTVANQSLSLVRGCLCVLGLACLIFLQGMLLTMTEIFPKFQGR